MLRIRDIDIDPSLVLAPMEAVTDLTFRRLIRQIGGCGLTVTEFIPARSLARGDPKFLRMAEFDPDERPVAIQIYGADPEVMAQLDTCAIRLPLRDLQKRQGHLQRRGRQGAHRRAVGRAPARLCCDVFKVL